MLSTDFPCMCGHEWNQHKGLINNPNGTICQRCYWLACNGLVSKNTDFYHTFQPDNLRYLEIQYERSI